MDEENEKLFQYMQERDVIRFGMSVINVSKIMRVRDLEVKLGEKRSGFLKIGEAPLSEINFPIGIINGIKHGPTLCIIAGEHAMEYPGIEAAIRIFRNTAPEELSGALIVVPVVNSPAFEARTPYVCPIDNVNVSRAGMEGGTISHIIARTLSEEVTSKADYLLNLHGGDLPELLYPFTIVELIGDEKIDATSVTIGKIFGNKYIIHRKSPRAREDRLKYGIPHIISEAGSLGMLDENDIEAHVTGVTNVMKHLKMIMGEPIIQADQKVIVERLRIRASRGGLFYPKVESGDIVSKGDLLGEIKDVWGETREELIAPEDHLLVYMIFMRHVVNTGDPIFSLGLIE